MGPSICSACILQGLALELALRSASRRQEVWRRQDVWRMPDVWRMQDVWRMPDVGGGRALHGMMDADPGEGCWWSRSTRCAMVEGAPAS